MKKIKNSQPQTKFTGSYKKKECNRFEHDSLLATEWVENNYMKLNQEKCHLLVSGHTNTKIFGQGSEKRKSGKVGNKNY